MVRPLSVYLYEQFTADAASHFCSCDTHGGAGYVTPVVSKLSAPPTSSRKPRSGLFKPDTSFGSLLSDHGHLGVIIVLPSLRLPASMYTRSFAMGCDPIDQSTIEPSRKVPSGCMCNQALSRSA